MKLSILDQIPISTGQTEKEALEASIQLAKLGDELGYERFWVAEHHDLFGLACPNPAIMLGVIGAQTEKIRLGAGAVLLPYYKPFHVAETYQLLETLYPGRIDIGLGRAPGGPAEVSMALSDNYLAGVRKFSEHIDELHMFLHDTFPTDHPYHKVTPTPVPKNAPKTWLLGTSEKSARLAAEKQMNYVFGHFMTDVDGPAIVQQYNENRGEKGYVIVAVHVICAASTEAAELLAKSVLLWKERQHHPHAPQTIPSIKEVEQYPFTKIQWEKAHTSIVIGNPREVAEKLNEIQTAYNADELMIVTITHDPVAKQQSYQLLAQEIIR